MQRLFSTFPNGLPGHGLLLLRLSCGTPLLIIGAAKLPGWPADSLFFVRVLGSLTGVLIVAGLWTPIAATCHAILQGVLAFAGEAFEWAHLIVALIGLSLVMIGPGAWSIDARLYGRKRIDLDR